MNYAVSVWFFSMCSEYVIVVWFWFCRPYSSIEIRRTRQRLWCRHWARCRRRTTSSRWASAQRLASSSTCSQLSETPRDRLRFNKVSAHSQSNMSVSIYWCLCVYMSLRFKGSYSWLWGERPSIKSHQPPRIHIMFGTWEFKLCLVIITIYF